MLARAGFFAVVFAVALAPLALIPRAAAAAPKYYIELKDTEEAAGVKSGLVAEARKLLEESLKKRPDVVLAEKGAKAPTEEELKAKGLRGIAMVVRIESMSDEIVPPPSGKGYKQLQGSIRTTVLGTAVPSQMMVLSGDGECTVGTQVSGGQASEAEKKGLRMDALKDALGQSLDKAFKRLGEKPKDPKKKPKKKAA